MGFVAGGVQPQTRICTGLGLRMKFLILFMSDDIERLDCSPDCEHDDGCGRKKNTAIILICHSRPSFHNMSKQLLAPGGVRLLTGKGGTGLVLPIPVKSWFY